MRDFTDDLRELHRRLDEAEVYLRVGEARNRLTELEAEIGRPDLWDDADAAKALTAEYANLRDDVATYDGMASTLDDLDVLHELAREEDDETQEPELADGVAELGRRLDQLDLRSLFTGEHDAADAIVQINAKDGGVDAQDWSEMLLRMYERWAERRGLKFAVDGVSEGTEAGILSAEFTLSGRYAYGLMTSERGTHRLVRISPFDNQGRRQTSFAAVQVWPVMDDPDVELAESDIRMEVFRASGAGGQHVNKTSSAVRLIHEPTGLVASSQEERSQLQNREKALGRLKAMVAAKVEEERAAELDAIAGKQAQVGWGSQIRSYVLQPYQMVKDLRTEIESGNVAAVLDGDLDEFMEGYLRWRRATARELTRASRSRFAGERVGHRLGACVGVGGDPRRDLVGRAALAAGTPVVEVRVRPDDAAAHRPLLARARRRDAEVQVACRCPPGPPHVAQRLAGARPARRARCRRRSTRSAPGSSARRRHRRSDGPTAPRRRVVDRRVVGVHATATRGRRR